MITTEGRTASQLAALERRKTHLDPRDIAKFYKDMIINVFNNIVSINMICIHKSVPTNIDANEILDINEFPDMYNTPNTK